MGDGIQSNYNNAPPFPIFLGVQPWRLFFVEWSNHNFTYGAAPAPAGVLVFEDNMEHIASAVEQAARTAEAETPPVSEFEELLIRHLPQGPFNWSLALGVCLAFMSQLSSIGKGIQKVGVQSLPELSYRPSVLKQYCASKTWRRGMLLDIAGAVFGFTSLTILPISVAQPIFCNGLVLLACYSHFYLKEQLASREWRAIGMCFLGTVLLAVTLVPRDWSRTHVGWLQVKLAMVLLLVLPLLLLVECGLRRMKR